MVTELDLVKQLTCEDCPLEGRPQIPGCGTEESGYYNLVFVAIAPAREEVAQKSVLVGWSGKLLRMTLQKLGITKFWLTNTLLCEMPPDFPAAEQKQALACCRDRLMDEVKSKDPQLVVALGNIPLEAFTGVDYKITQVAGRILPGLVCPVLPVINPAALRHRPDEFIEFTNNLWSGKKYLAGTYTQAVVPTTTLVDESNMVELCELIERNPVVALDLETTNKGFFPYGREPDQIRCIALAFDSKSAWIVPGKSSPYFPSHPDYSEHPSLKKAINGANLIFHNGPFDIGFLKQAGYDPYIFFDTFLAHYLLDER